MKRMVKPLFIITAILGAASFSMSLAAHDRHQENPAAAETLATHTHPAGHASHDHVAVTDMRAYAAHAFGAATLLPHTYGSAVHWSHDWELRWADYKTDDHIVRVYHATYKHGDGVRYTSSCARGQTCKHDWKRIQ